MSEHMKGPSIGRMNSEPNESQLTSIRKSGAAAPANDIKIAGPLAVAIVDNYRELTAKAAEHDELVAALKLARKQLVLGHHGAGQGSEYSKTLSLLGDVLAKVREKGG